MKGTKKRSASSARRSAASPSSAPRVARASLDGRHARAHKSRQAVIEAFLSLLREGQLTPSTQDVAERAGLTQRTLFNQFSDVSALLAAVGEYHLEQARATLPPLPDEGDATQRITRYVSDLSGFLETFAPVRWAALSYSGVQRDIRRSIERMRKIMNDRLGALLLSCGLDPARDPELLQALESVLDPMAWRMLRILQGLSVARARAVMTRSVLALIHDAQR